MIFLPQLNCVLTWAVNMPFSVVPNGYVIILKILYNYENKTDVFIDFAIGCCQYVDSTAKNNVECSGLWLSEGYGLF